MTKNCRFSIQTDTFALKIDIYLIFKNPVLTHLVVIFQISHTIFQPPSFVFPS